MDLVFLWESSGKGLIIYRLECLAPPPGWSISQWDDVILSVTQWDSMVHYQKIPPWREGRSWKKRKNTALRDFNYWAINRIYPPGFMRDGSWKRWTLPHLVSADGDRIHTSGYIWYCSLSHSGRFSKPLSQFSITILLVMAGHHRMHIPEMPWGWIKITTQHVLLLLMMVQTIKCI